MPLCGYTSVKTISVTGREQREQLGETITTWLAEHPHLELVEKVVLQSSSRERHNLTVVLFLRERT